MVSNMKSLLHVVDLDEVLNLTDSNSSCKYLTVSNNLHPSVGFVAAPKCD